MTATGRVFHQQDFTAAKCAVAAVGDFQLDGAVKQHDELALRRVVPVVVVSRIVLSEDDGFRGDRPREPTDLAGAGQFDLDIGKMRFALVISVDTGDLHVRCSCPRVTRHCKSDRAAASSSFFAKSPKHPSQNWGR